MMRSFLAMYNPLRMSAILTYMLQSTEYQVGPYLHWFWRTQDFSSVMYRRTLAPTRAAKLLRRALLAGMAVQIALGIVLIALGYFGPVTGGELFGLALIAAFPVLWAHLAVLPLLLGRYFIVAPREAKLVEKSSALFAKHPGVKIAVAGSYGKTSMKELLLTVLSAGNKKVAATPANKNVAISHAYFAAKLAGDEDILIIEYGEGAPGDVARFAATTHPTHGIITGLAPAHLDKYKTLQAAGTDIFGLAEYLNQQQVFVNGESTAMQPFLQSTHQVYDASGALGWKSKNIKLSTAGTAFDLVKGKKTIKLTSGLLGAHQVGPLSLAAALALEFGLTEKQVVAGVAATQPFEHRMQARQMSGAWIIDDTYNGNIEGVRVGTELLAALPAKRKIYVTPGLVDQGKESKTVHLQMGKLIAAARPDKVVLMKNSAMQYIKAGLEQASFVGEVIIESDPLRYYTNLDQHLAAGDLVLMQNDWTDNYS